MSGSVAGLADSPVHGAVGLGVIGFFVPRVLGVGYDTISDILNRRLPAE